MRRYVIVPRDGEFTLYRLDTEIFLLIGVASFDLEIINGKNMSELRMEEIAVSYLNEMRGFKREELEIQIL